MYAAPPSPSALTAAMMSPSRAVNVRPAWSPAKESVYDTLRRSLSGASASRQVTPGAPAKSLAAAERQQCSCCR